ncbi:MAG: S41 family peptidase [Actinomycetales bacterium]
MRRTVVRRAALVGGVAAAYLAGVLTGALGSHPAPAAPSTAGGVLDRAAAEIADTAAAPVDRATLERAALRAMVEQLHDRWSAYYPAAQFQSQQDALEGRYVGVGLWLRPTASSAVEVGSVTPGSPAARAGLHVGDLVLAVAHHSTAGRTAGDVAATLRGARGERTDLTVRRGAQTLDVTLPHADVTAANVSVEQLRPRVLDIQITSFARGVGRQVRQVLQQDPERHRDGVVLDLRGNPGGLVDEAVEVAGAFLDGGTVVSYDRRGHSRTTLSAPPGGDVHTPLVVLVDAGTASAAEVVSAALQERNRAVLVGTRTFGKGSVQEPVELPDGGALELTVGRYFTPSGRSIEGIGLTPDVTLAASDDPAVALRRGVDVLAGLVASLPGSGRG